MKAPLLWVRVFLASLLFVTIIPARAQTNSLFADPNLERAVRDALQKPTGELTPTDLAGLISLQAPNYRIKTLSGLEAALNLRTLDVSQNDITDITAVSALSHLDYLDLSYNSPRDLTPVLGLTNVSSLFLASIGLEPAPALERMSALTQLGLAQNHIPDPVPLRTLTNLHYLNLTDNPITSIASLSDLTNLETLSLGQLSLTNAQPLVGFTHLMSLELYDNRLTDLAPLLSLTNLQGLDLSGNPVRDWTPLTNLTNLFQLTLGGVALSNLNWVASLRNLNFLSLPHNALSDLSPLVGLSNLYYLDLNENPLVNCGPLAALPQLSYLSLDGNSIDDLSSLAHLYVLRTLSLVRNRVWDLTPMSGLTNLGYLELGFNLVTNISVLNTFPQLRSVALHQNLLDLTPGSEAMTVIESLQTNGVSVYYQPQLQQPEILVRPRWLLVSGQKAWLSGLLIDDAASPVQPVSVAAHSSNPALIADAGLVVSVSGNYFNWELPVTPAQGQTGLVTLAIAATNYAGLWTNATVALQVLQPVPFSSDALDAPQLTWNTAGDLPWSSETSLTHDGVDAAQSGTPDSVIQTTVTGPGTFRFWWKLQSDYYYAHSQFNVVSLDSDRHGSEQLFRNGEIWQQDLVGLPAGHWLLTWSPTLDFWCCGGDLNSLWLDQVTFEPGQPGCWLEPKSYELDGGGRFVYFHGGLGQSYEVEVSEDLIHWSPLTQVTCDNFVMSVIDRKIGAVARFYRARGLSAL